MYKRNGEKQKTEDNEFKDNLNPEQLENVSGGNAEWLPDVMFFVEVHNGTRKRTETFDTEQYHEIATVKKWIREREKLGPCEIRIYNAEGVELTEGSLRANNVKFGDMLKAIVSQGQ